MSHDLRTPLASIKASISSLRQRDIEWPPEVVDDSALLVAHFPLAEGQADRNELPDAPVLL